MDLYVLNEDLELLCLIDCYTSFILNRKYYECGEFELNCALTDANLELLVKKNIIYRKDDEEVAIINYVEYSTDSDGQETIKVTGNFATIYLERRIAKGTTEYTDDTAENLIRTLIENNATDPTDTDRTIPNFYLGDDNSITTSADYTLDNNNLLDDIENIAYTADLGFKTVFDTTAKTFTFEIYEGVDRTTSQSTNPRAIFCKEFENVLEQEYIDSLVDYKNYGYDSSDNESGDTTGLDRYEIYTDDEDIDDYLEDYEATQTFSCVINTNGNLVYKTDYDLGDEITFVSKKLGLTLDTRITEVQETYEEDGLSLDITFGDSAPTIIDVIKKKFKRR
jgi:hypothetical protein